MPQAPRPNRSPGTEVVISALLGGILLVGPDLVSAVLSIVIGNDLDDAHDPKRWIFFAVYATASLFTVAMLLTRGRTAGKRIGAAIVFVVLVGLSDLRWAASIAGLSVLTLQDQPVWVVITFTTSTFTLSWILGWSIARRQTGFAWIGLIPALLLLGGWIALLVNDVVDIHVGPQWMSEMLNNLLYDLVAFLGIVCLWIFDVVGLSMRRPAPLAQPYGVPPGYQVPQPIPYQMPGYPPYQQQAPNHPPARPGPTYPTQRF